MITKPDFLPIHTKWYSAPDRTQIGRDLSQYLTDELQRVLVHNQRASLALSGGRTPIPLLQALAQEPLPWHNIEIILTDERWVNEDHSDSNAALVKHYLLQGPASSACFIPLKNQATSANIGQQACHHALQQMKRPLDLLLLGMGNDGHTASLFPCCPELAAAMDPTNPQLCLATRPTTAIHNRINLTYTMLTQARQRILHICGDDKLATLAQAMTIRNAKKMPIFAFLQRPLSIYWSA